MAWMNFEDFPWAGKKPHDGVSQDWSMRVGTWEGDLREPLGPREIAETAGWPRLYEGIGPLTDDVRSRIENAANV